MVVFAVCLIAGIDAGNAFATTLGRALLAMGGTLVLGLVVGAMAQKMLDEHVAAKAGESAKAGAAEEPPAPDAADKKSAGAKISRAKSAAKGR